MLNISMKQKADMVGLTSGELTVLGNSGEYYLHPSRKIEKLVCRCSCGKIVLVRRDSIKSKKTKSCGCIQKEKAKLTGKKNKLPPSEKPFRDVYYNYKHRRPKGFDLTVEEFRELSQRACYYCGDSPSNMAKNSKDIGDVFVYNGIDRIDSSKGYEKNNVVACCQFCNYAKSNYTQIEFISKVKKIYDTHCKK